MIVHKDTKSERAGLVFRKVENCKLRKPSKARLIIVIAA